ncbi:MAG: glycogen/starch/alpha-glucan phosphorylase, partial [Planctomycetota bacterium]
GLRELLNDVIGDGWQDDLTKIQSLEGHADDPELQTRWAKVKLDNKRKLAEHVAEHTGVLFDTSMMFDVQVKRIHEYKRQLLNVLHVIHLYDRILRGDTAGMTPRCVLIGGKAAPGYHVAKLIVKLINDVGSVVNSCAKANDLLKLVFFPNYRVSTMEVICPASELSEQISTAGKEASGTGNMKFMMNGALTIGTLDGANIEIRDNAGEENFFLFGMTADEVTTMKQDYRPNDLIAADEDISRVMNLLESGHFNPANPGLFDLLTGGLRSPHDPWVTIGDLRSYIDAQVAVNNAYQDAALWNRMSILNTAGSGWFSSDRTIGQYASDIWDVRAIR